MLCRRVGGLFIKGENGEIAWCAGICIFEISDVEGLNSSCGKTNIVDPVRGKLMCEFELCDSDVIWIYEAETRRNNFAIFIVCIQSSCSLEHVHNSRVKLLGALSFFFSSLSSAKVNSFG